MNRRHSFKGGVALTFVATHPTLSQVNDGFYVPTGKNPLKDVHAMARQPKRVC